MAPQIAKVKTAYQYFQSERMASTKQELGPNISLGQLTSHISSLWRGMSQQEREPYILLENEDRKRFMSESAIADAQAISEQEARRSNLVAKEGEDVGQRGARQKINNERAALEEEREKRRSEREAQLDPEELEERRRIKAQKKAETLERQRRRQDEEDKIEERHKKLNKEASKQAQKRLDYLLRQSSIFGQLKMGKGGPKKEGSDAKYVPHHRDEALGKRKKNDSSSKTAESKDEGEEDSDDAEDENNVFLMKQPSCIKFGTLKPYQLEGLNWMIHLSEKGLNGILADEMGLGKTLQSISILAYHYEFHHIQGPHLICVPKSTLSNWMNELARWCPSLRAIKFHGSKEEKADLAYSFFSNEAAAHDGKRPTKKVKNEETGEMEDDNSDNPRAWDVCVTTYEVCNTEKQVLSKFPWKYLVIDEAHRLKNEASMFSKTVRGFRTSHRLLLTGTPLQNNLHELWALLNFLLPDIFSSSEQFDEWFDLEIEDTDAKKNMISQLHKILRPFMLRRLKADVAKGLPPKTETLVMVGMSSMQKKLYKNLLLRDIENITSNASSKNKTAILNIVMQLRKCCGHPYLFEGIEDRTLDPLGEHLVDNCGKLSMVDKLLKKLKERGNRVLIFTQMTRVLDILEDYMVMRGYQYCRIDGNTEYEVREESIDAFNAPNSEKFCFILSTRAGGLGINLQTADTVILYDSDWNPQADLQAQDRCHRLGQTKPVSIYRLVSENTIEEKIVERAQQKLKLDAMVVQQGRLKEKDKVSKDEMMAAVRFGADTVFRSEESTITDDDIDIILERGKAKTKELAEKLQKAEKGDLLDFRLDGGMSAQTFEGIDYSDIELRNQLRLLAADSIGKRERKPPPINYNAVTQPKKSMIVNNRKIKLPKALRIPRMEDHQFYNRERLLELGKLEFQTYANLKQCGNLPPRDEMEKRQSVLPHEYAVEKMELLAEGFGDWTRGQYFHFVKAAATFGRDDLASISLDMDLPIESVTAYSKAFWMYGPTELKKDEWERFVSNIEKGEAKIAKRRKLSALLRKFVSTFDNPRKEMTFANKGTSYFAQEQDTALLCAVDKYGYGNWDQVREALRLDDALLFQHSVQGMNADAIAKRCDYRMRQLERELEAREKKLKSLKPPSLLAAEKAIEAIKEMEEWECNAYEAQLQGSNLPSCDHLSGEAKQYMKERLNDREQVVERFREIEIQLRGCKELADQTKQSILRGDQYVNYSHITLKAGGLHITKDGAMSDLDGIDMEAYVNKSVLSIPECGDCKSCRDGKVKKLCIKRLEVRNKMLVEFNMKMKEWVSTCKHDSNLMKNSMKDKKDRLYWPRKRSREESLDRTSTNGTASAKKSKKKISPPGNPLGNKRMSVPEELLPEFCKRIGVNGTSKRMQTIEEFVRDYPTVSIRQVTFKFAELTTRDLPGCVDKPEKPKGKGRAFTFFLRPRFYHHLPEEDRPTSWETFAKEDELLYLEECSKADAFKPENEEVGQDDASLLGEIED